MEERPILDKNLKSETFQEYYYLKEELVQFCRDNGLPVSGGKIELTERIAHYLDTGESKTVRVEKGKASGEKRKRLVETVAAGKRIGSIEPDSLIEQDFVCSEKHRAFFKEHLGKSFSFCVPFQKWLKENSGKTYEDAIAAYKQIVAEKKLSKTKIDKQFEYNTYIRDFFEDNKGKSLEDAILCWKYKRSMPGHNRYEKTDLCALEEKEK